MLESAASEQGNKYSDMLKRFDIMIPSDYEEPLLGLAELLGVTAFSSPQIRDAEPKFCETDYEMTGETLVSFVVSTLEQDVPSIESSIKKWLKDFSIEQASVQMIEYSDQQDWMAGFREHFQPIFVGKNIVVKPPWSEPLKRESSSVSILIDPGMAFGTGTHETTRLSLALLEKNDPSGQFFLDLGAGSGILSFYLMKRGASAGIAIEIEGAAVENMKKNAALNGISDRLQMKCSDIVGFKALKVPADGLVANITTPVIMEYLPIFTPWVKKGGWGVFSGVNFANADLVKNAFGENGWKLLEEMAEGEWRGFLLTRL